MAPRSRWLGAQGPYAGRDFSGTRFQYWLPADELAVPALPGLPGWAQAVAAGKRLHRPRGDVTGRL
jgi:hypothetical protein